MSSQQARETKGGRRASSLQSLHLHSWGSANSRAAIGQLRGQLTELHRTTRERQEAMVAAMAITSMNEPMAYMSLSLPPVGLNTCAA